MNKKFDIGDRVTLSGNRWTWRFLTEAKPGDIGIISGIERVGVYRTFSRYRVEFTGFSDAFFPGELKAASPIRRELIRAALIASLACLCISLLLFLTGITFS